MVKLFEEGFSFEKFYTAFLNGNTEGNMDLTSLQVLEHENSFNDLAAQNLPLYDKFLSGWRIFLKTLAI